MRQSANYGGAQASLHVTTVKNNDLEVGVYGFGQHQSNYFNNVFTDCGTSCQNFGPSSAAVTGGLIEEFISDRYKVTSWLTLIAGLRESHFTTHGVSGERDISALRRRAADSASELGFSRFLGPLSIRRRRC